MSCLVSTRSIFILLGLISVVLFGCASTGTTPVQNGLPNLLTEAKKAYLKGISEKRRNDKQLDKARRLARTYVKRSPDGQYTSDAWLIVGKVEFQKKRYRHVLSAVENGLNESSAADLTVELLMLKGRVSHLLGKTDQGLQAYQSAKEMVDEQSVGGDRVNVAELKYRRANTLVQTGKFEQAERAYRSLIDEFPDSIYARKSRDRIRFMTDYYSVQLGLFRQKQNALSLKRDLEQDGREPYVLSTPTRDGTLYSVRLGKFNRFEQARKLADRLKEQGHDVIVKP